MPYKATRITVKMVLAHPGGGEGNERKAQQERHIGPEHRTVHLLHYLEHMVMVVPIDGEVDEAQYIGSEYRQDGFEI